jgi:ribonuclease T2
MIVSRRSSQINGDGWNTTSFSLAVSLTRINSSTINDKHFDYFDLVLQWPPGFGSSIGDTVSHWTIHGLWPSRLIQAASYPCTCTSEPFDKSQIASIENTMREFWPSLMNSDSPSFWKHEWEKHGTCSTPYVKTQLEYFKKTLDLRAANDPGKILAKFVPSQVKPYPLLSIVASFKKKVILTCQNRDTSNQNLESVVFCMTKASNPVQFDCPDAVIDAYSGKCSSKSPIFILPAKSMPTIAII